jgi:hypothetical protein
MFRVLQPRLFDEVPELGMGFHFGIDDAGNGYMVLNGEIALTIDDLIEQAMAEKFWDSAQRADLAIEDVRLARKIGQTFQRCGHFP